MARPRKPLPDHITAELRDLVEALRHHTDASGVTLTTLCARTNLSTATISRTLSGSHVPTQPVLTALIDGLQLNVRQRQALIGHWQKAEQAARDRREGTARARGEDSVDAQEKLHNLRMALGRPPLRTLEASTGIARSTLQRALVGDAPADTTRDAAQRFEEVWKELRDRLTSREVEIAIHLANGMTVEGIARACGLSPQAVYAYRSRISTKFAAAGFRPPAPDKNDMRHAKLRHAPVRVGQLRRHLEEATARVAELELWSTDDQRRSLESVDALLTALDESRKLALEIRKQAEASDGDRPAAPFLDKMIKDHLSDHSHVSRDAYDTERSDQS